MAAAWGLSTFVSERTLVIRSVRDVRQGFVASIIVAIGLLSCGGRACASDYLGVVQSIVQIGYTAWIYVGGGHFGTHTCGSSQAELIVYLDPTTAQGQSYLSLAISAKLAGTQVYVAGNDVCYTNNTPNGSISEAITVFWQQ